jgi:hypothetical protein
MHSLRTATAFAVLTLLTQSLSAQEWYREHQNGPPPARRFHALGHLAGGNVLFGGVDEQSGIVLGDTWRYDGMQWTAVTSSGPGPRQRFAACVDSTRGMLVVFGGQDDNGQVRGDTWQFDGSTWLPVLTTNAPSSRLGAAMAFDAARGVAVLFGGGPNANAPTRETWEFDGLDWTLRTSAHTPTPRQGHAMAFDTARNVTMLFGGFGPASGFDAETWQWNGSDWQRVVTATTPPASPFPALTFFEPHGVAVLTSASGSGAQPLSTWVFDGSDWSVGPSSPVGFSGRQGQAMAYDREREMVVLFGGARIAIGGAVPHADTWELSVRATFESFGNACTFASGTPRLRNVGDARPQLGSSLPLVVEPAGRLALFVAGTSDTDWLGTPLPLDLAPFGMPGCELFTSIDWTALAVPVGRSARTALAIPSQRALLGARIFVQAIATDPSATIPGAVSNAARVTIGN